MPVSLGTTTIAAIYLGTTSITSAYLGATQVFGGSFTPLDLFSGGAQGIWLDPSDLSTMFSDRAGTIQVTTPGTVVGKRLDKSGRGNHAVAPTDAARPVYGVEPKGGRRNLLTFSEQFDNAAWVKSNVTVASTQYLAPDGTTTAERMVLDSATSTHFINTPVSSAGVGRHVASYYVKADGANFLQIAFGSASNPNNAFVNYDLSAGSVGTANSATGAIQSLPNGWFRISCVCDFDAAASQHSVVIVQSATSARLPSFAGDGTSGVYIWGAQLELGSTATAYQKVVTAYNVTESGVPTCHYLQYDGSDDSMSTSAIDFTGTDKMSVFAGVRKLSDAARGMVAELSSGSATTGAWNLNAPDGAVANFAFRNVGSLGGGDAVTSSTFTAPTSNVLTAIGDIAADVSQLRVNGSVAATSAVDLGTGNYGNYPLFIGRRNNATLPFNGRDFGIIIVGKAASAGEITDTEAWLAARTSGVSL